ncbi:hypothetical protein LWI28_025842 [Acer negundo]|uniref:Uncharacterized protein n=1 Tax=Acer negundo TaxID=4023 RepID=A0AAD5J8C4_ACENE|nr:hypothetical protein LWI28_025842 [Acer negundo]
MGCRYYVKKAAGFLDPESNYFDARIIAREDSRGKPKKNLGLVLGQKCEENHKGDQRWVPGTTDHVSGTTDRYQGPGTKDHRPDTKNHIPGMTDNVPGMTEHVPRTTNKLLLFFSDFVFLSGVLLKKLMSTCFDLLLEAAKQASDEDLRNQNETSRTSKSTLLDPPSDLPSRTLLVVREENEAFKKSIKLCFKIQKNPRCNNFLKRHFFSQHTQEEEEGEEEIARKPPLKKRRKTYNLEKKKKNPVHEMGLELDPPTDIPVELRNQNERRCRSFSEVYRALFQNLKKTQMQQFFEDTFSLNTPKKKIGRRRLPRNLH